MRYTPVIQKNLKLIHPINKVLFKILEGYIGTRKTNTLKQRTKLFFKEKPTLTASSGTERALFEKIKDEMSVVFDVGIQNELSFYKIKPDCQYHLFEPNKKFIKLIKKQMATFDGHQIRLNEYGLSDKPEENITYYEESESFMVNSTYKYGDTDTGQKYSLKTLDSYVKENNIAKIDFLKIDTEGFDYRILLGSMETIRANKIGYIQFEYWDGARKFHNLLSPLYDMYVVMEPRLYQAVMSLVFPKMNNEEKKIDFKKSLIKLDETMINLFDKKISPTGAGANIFCIQKTKNNAAQKLIFDVI